MGVTPTGWSLYNSTVRTVTTWTPDANGNPTNPVSRPYTADENIEADNQQFNAARITDLDGRVKALEAIVLGNIPDPPSTSTPVWSPPCPPNAITRWPDSTGKRYRNISQAWLTANPGQYAIGYVNLDATVIGAWATGVTYKVGDQVTYQGKTYQCAQAHQSQAGWTPPAVPALWTLV